MLLLTAGRADSLAWGCDGHRAIAIIAERILGATADRVAAVLKASPVDPGLRHFCDSVPSDIIADVSTWADDMRDVEPATASQHFIDFPRALRANTNNPSAFCPGGGCVVDAIVTRYRQLTTSTDPVERATALRFLIHFIGDIHQPFHAVTNGDRGGTCLPVRYFRQPVLEDDKGNFRPNLHSVWDGETIRRLMRVRGLMDAQELASYVADQDRPASVAPIVPTAARVTAWARQSNSVARRVGYGALSVNPPLEPASAWALKSCAENDHVGRRMLALNERIGAAYERQSVPVIATQLRLAGERLAAVLMAAFVSR